MKERMHKCPSCGCLVPDERLELLGTEYCIKCSPDRPPLRGVMEYGHKTAGVLVLTDDPTEFEALKKPANQRR